MEITGESDKGATQEQKGYELLLNEAKALDVAQEKAYAEILSKFPENLTGFEEVYLASFDDRHLVFSTETVRENINVGLANNIHGIVVYDLIEDRVVVSKNMENIEGVVSDAIFVGNTLYFSIVCDSNKKNTYSVYSLQENNLNLILTSDTDMFFAAQKLALFSDGENVFTVAKIENDTENTTALIKFDIKQYEIVHIFEKESDADYIKNVGKTFYITEYIEEKQYVYVFKNLQVKDKILMPKIGEVAILENIILQYYRVDPTQQEGRLVAYDFNGNILLEHKMYKPAYTLMSDGENLAYFVGFNWSLWTITLQDKTLTLSEISTNEEGDPIRFHNKGKGSLFLFDGKEKMIKTVK